MSTRIYGTNNYRLDTISSLPYKRVAWSYSRRSVFDQCPRRYYYQYYGSDLRTALEEPHKDTLKQLKGLQNRYERVGALLHLAIATYFRQAQAGEILTLPRLLNGIQKMFRDDYTYSIANSD